MDSGPRPSLCLEGMPEEMKLAIIRYLHDKALFSVCLTAKAYCRIAQPVLFEDCEAHRPEQLRPILHTMLKWPKLAQKTKKLTVCVGQIKTYDPEIGQEDVDWKERLNAQSWSEFVQDFTQRWPSGATERLYPEKTLAVAPNFPWREVMFWTMRLEGDLQQAQIALLLACVPNLAYLGVRFWRGKASRTADLGTWFPVALRSIIEGGSLRKLHTFNASSYGYSREAWLNGRPWPQGRVTPWCFKTLQQLLTLPSLRSFGGETQDLSLRTLIEDNRLTALEKVDLRHPSIDVAEFEGLFRVCPNLRVLRCTVFLDDNRWRSTYPEFVLACSKIPAASRARLECIDIQHCGRDFRPHGYLSLPDPRAFTSLRELRVPQFAFLRWGAAIAGLFEQPPLAFALPPSVERLELRACDCNIISELRHLFLHNRHRLPALRALAVSFFPDEAARLRDHWGNRQLVELFQDLDALKAHLDRHSSIDFSWTGPAGLVEWFELSDDEDEDDDDDDDDESSD